MAKVEHYTEDRPTTDQIDQAVLLTLANPDNDRKRGGALTVEVSSRLALESDPDTATIKLSRVVRRIELIARLASQLVDSALDALASSRTGSVASDDLRTELGFSALSWLARHGGDEPVDFDQIGDDALAGLLRHWSYGRITREERSHGHVYVDAVRRLRQKPGPQDAPPASGALRALRAIHDRAESTPRRLNFTISPVTAAQVDELANSLGGATQTEVVRRAVALLHQFGTEFAAGQSAGAG